MYGFYSRKTSELFNKYISIQNIKSYLNKISNDKYLITDGNEKYLIDNIVCFYVNLYRYITVNISEKNVDKDIFFDSEIGELINEKKPIKPE